MGRPKKPEVGSTAWARSELKIAERRLRDLCRRIEAAGEADLPGLLRLELSLRKEIERLARAAAPPVLTERWCDGDDLVEAVLEEEESDDY